MDNNLKSYLNYTEIYRQRDKVKPKFIWLASFGRFIQQKRDFRGQTI